MAELKEISRVLVLESFNDKLSLPTVLNDAKDPETNEFNYRRVNIDGLRVRSFDEFIKKFAPDIYQGFKVDENGGYFVYSTDPYEIPDSHPMPIDKTSFFKAALDLYTKKGVSGDSNFEFDYSEFSKYISPQNAMKEIKKKRRELEYTTQKMLEAIDQGNSVQSKNYKKKAKNIVNDIKSNYQNNPTALLCLSIADLENKLSISLADSGSGKAGLPAPADTYRLIYNKDGDIVKEKVRNTSPNGIGGNTALLENKASEQVALLLDKTFRTDGASESEQYQQELVISVCSGNTGFLPDDVEERNKRMKKLQRQYEVKKQFYKASQDSLLKSINKIIEKMLDVKALFDNSNGKADVIIANCSAQDLVDGEMKEMFADYMKNLNNNINDKIWFAVLPQIGDEDLVDPENSGRIYTPDIPLADDEDENDTEKVIRDIDTEPADKENNIWEDDDEEETVTSTHELTSLSTAKILIDIFDKAKCIVFFGYKGGRKTGFSCMKKSMLDKYRDKLKSIKTPYAVFSYPNFTLMSGEQAGDIAVAQGEKIENPGFYLDAPYFAAALTIRSLNNTELDKLGFMVNENLPDVCVRFDFEDSSNDYECRNKITTNMNCEEKLKYDTELMEELIRSPFGFFFDPVSYYNGEPVKNTVVRYARNMAAKENRIFTTLVKDFIWLDMAKGEIKISKKKIDEYKSRNRWSRYENFINNPLRRGEEFGAYEVDGKLRAYVKFDASDEKNLIDGLEVDDTEE